MLKNKSIKTDCVKHTRAWHVLTKMHKKMVTILNIYTQITLHTQFCLASQSLCDYFGLGLISKSKLKEL